MNCYYQSVLLPQNGLLNDKLPSKNIYWSQAGAWPKKYRIYSEKGNRNNH